MDQVKQNRDELLLLLVVGGLVVLLVLLVSVWFCWYGSPSPLRSLLPFFALLYNTLRYISHWFVRLVCYVFLIRFNSTCYLEQCAPVEGWLRITRETIIRGTHVENQNVVGHP